MFRLAEIHVIFGRLVKNPLIDLAQGDVCDKVPFQIGEKLKIFFRIFRVQAGAQEIVELVCLKLFRRVGNHFSRQFGARCHRVKHLSKTRLQALRQIGVGHQLRIEQMEFIHGSLLAQR